VAIGAWLAATWLRRPLARRNEKLAANQPEKAGFSQ